LSGEGGVSTEQGGDRESRSKITKKTEEEIVCPNGEWGTKATRNGRKKGLFLRLFKEPRREGGD